MECELRSYGLYLSIDGLPTVCDMTLVRERARILVSTLDVPYVVRCHIRRMGRMPTSGHLDMAAGFLLDDDKHKCTIVSHCGGRVVRSAHRAFRRLYTPLKPLVIMCDAVRADAEAVRWTSPESDDDFEWV